MSNTVRLANCEERASKSEAFGIPHVLARKNLQVGDFAKLIFEDIHERMWVRVTERKPDGGFVGVLVNRPVASGDIQEGDSVDFSYYHIADVQAGKEPAPVATGGTP